ncbi:ankyrin repeat domain-containing protein [Flavitalea flava]
MKNETIVDYAEKNNVEGILKLLEIGEDINQIEYGRGALHSTTLLNSIEAAALLINRGINLNLQDKGSGATALHYSGVYNCLEISNYILTGGGRLDISDNYGNHPLWTAVFNVKGMEKRLPLVKLFLENGADKNHKNLAGRSPLDFSNQVKYFPLIQLLEKY